jgi:hypothetical protein
MSAHPTDVWIQDDIPTTSSNGFTAPRNMSTDRDVDDEQPKDVCEGVRDILCWRQENQDSCSGQQSADDTATHGSSLKLGWAVG